MTKVNCVKYQSRKNLMKHANTSSLKKLNEFSCSTSDKCVEECAIGAYLFYNKQDGDLVKYSRLKQLRDDFSKSIKKDDAECPYCKMNKSINIEREKRESLSNTKIEISNELEQTIDDGDLNLSNIARDCKIDYSSLHKFIYSKKLSDLSLEKAEKVIEYIRNNN